MPVHLHELNQLHKLRVPRLLPHLETIPSSPVPIETQRLQLVDAILGIHILLKEIHVALVQDPQPEARVGDGDVAISVLGPLGPELVELSLPLVHGQAQFPQLLVPLPRQGGRPLSIVQVVVHALALKAASAAHRPDAPGGTLQLPCRTL